MPHTFTLKGGGGSINTAHVQMFSEIKYIGRVLYSLYQLLVAGLSGSLSWWRLHLNADPVKWSFVSLLCLINHKAKATLLHVIIKHCYVLFIDWEGVLFLRHMYLIWTYILSLEDNSYLCDILLAIRLLLSGVLFSCHVTLNCNMHSQTCV